MDASGAITWCSHIVTLCLRQLALESADRPYRIAAQMDTRLRVVILISLSAQALSADVLVGGKATVDPHHPPAHMSPVKSDAAQVDLGRSIFEIQWVATGTPGIAARTGVGPLFNAAACTACHNRGGQGHGPAGGGQAPVALVMQLESPPPDTSAQSDGDPIYGRVFNTSGLDGVRAEGTVTVQYREITGYYYPYGGRWTMRVPHYHLGGMSRGPLAPHTVIKPRLAPALFGVGLLEAVPESAITNVAATQPDDRTSGTIVWHLRKGRRAVGRFGWQGNSVSIRDQTTNALAHEMGVSSSDRSEEDCTPAEADCLEKCAIGPPEVSDQMLDALVTFLRTLAVPESPTHVKGAVSGSELFADLGCAGCHRPTLPVELPGEGEARLPGVITPYTDLRLHDLGMEMADEDASGVRVTSHWRTAPLWGLGYRLRAENHPTFLHDGRARSTEEAVLWHGGEAAYAKRKFVNLGPRARLALLRWLATL